MSVIGIDFGNESCYIAVAKGGGIETIANDYSLRATPAYVSFGERNRLLGVAAKNQVITNLKNTICDFKLVVGRKYRDPRVQTLLPSLTYRVKETADGDIGIEVDYLNESHVFTPTQITAMLLTKLKQTAEQALNQKITDVVIGVPFYLNDAERRAMLDAATAAGLTVLRLMNETAATALAYGIYKQDLPAADEKPRNVVFVDVGQTCLQVCAGAFVKGKAKMLAAVADTRFGGRLLDEIIAHHINDGFRNKYKIDATKNKRAWLRLLAEVEKLKKQMSANSTELPLSIECFMDEKDVAARLKRSDMESICSGAFTVVEEALRKCLADSGLRLDDVHSVEIVGGSSRVPAVKQLIEHVYGKTPSTTLNQDEAVARGCALQAAILSPNFKVREFVITDVQPYSIQMVWRDGLGQESDMEVFPRNHITPFTKMLTFIRMEPFTFQVRYTSPCALLDPIIGHYTVNEVAPTPEGESQQVKVKVSIDANGLFTKVCASRTEKVVKEAKEDVAPMDGMEEKNENNVASGDRTLNGPANDVGPQENGAEQKSDADKMECDKGEETAADKTSSPDTKKTSRKFVTKTIELPVQETLRCLSEIQINELTEKEATMMQADKLENERINARNAVEEYVYDLRSRLGEDLMTFVNTLDRESAMQFLEQTENWLYEEGEDCLKQIYLDKLTSLKNKGEPMKIRKREREEFPVAFECLLATVQRARKVVEQYRAGEDAFSHLEPAEVEKVEAAIVERQQWVDRHMGMVSSTPLHKDLSFTAAQVRAEVGTFQAIVNPVVNRPKPKPKVEEPPPSADVKDAIPDNEVVATTAAGGNEEPMDLD